MSPKNVAEWKVSDVCDWLKELGYDYEITSIFGAGNSIDGKALLTLREDDLRSMVKRIGDVKRLYISIRKLQRDNMSLLLEMGHIDLFSQNFYSPTKNEVTISIFYFVKLISIMRIMHFDYNIHCTCTLIRFRFVVTWRRNE